MAVTIRRGANRDNEHEVFAQEEADEKGISYVYWKKAEPGAWALTDDGYVAECLKRSVIGAGDDASTHIELSFARAWLPRTPELNFLPFHESGNYGGTSPESWVETESRRQRTVRTVQAYVQMMLVQEQIDWEMLGNIYRPNQEVPEATVRRLFKQDRIQTMVKRELRKILTGLDVDEDAVVDMYKKAFQKAEEVDNPSAMRAGAKDFAEMLDMKPDQRSVRYSEQWDFRQLEPGRDFPQIGDGQQEEIEIDIEATYEGSDE